MTSLDRTNIENEVLAWYQEYWNVPAFPFTKKTLVNKDISLSTGKYQLLWEDAEDLLVEYFEKFQVERGDFSFIKYFPGEYQSNLFDFIRRKKNRREYVVPVPLTLEMLMISAKSGHWLYD